MSCWEVTKKEYDAGQEIRLFADELAVSGIYATMFKLRRGGDPYGLGYYSRVNKVHELPTGSWRIIFDVLDSDYRVWAPGLDMVFSDGLMDPHHTATYRVEERPIVGGYFGNARDGIDEELSSATWLQQSGSVPDELLVRR